MYLRHRTAAAPLQTASASHTWTGHCPVAKLHGYPSITGPHAGSMQALGGCWRLGASWAATGELQTDDSLDEQLCGFALLQTLVQLEPSAVTQLQVHCNAACLLQFCQDYPVPCNCL